MNTIHCAFSAFADKVIKRAIKLGLNNYHVCYLTAVRWLDDSYNDVLLVYVDIYEPTIYCIHD